MKKEITLVIPTPILSSKELSEKDKLIFGLHYAYFKKGNATFESNIEIAKRLLLHANTVGKSNTLFEENQLIRKENSTYVVVKEMLDTLEKPNNEVEEILIPFEVYSKDIKAGAKLLWGEYNRFRNTEEGYKVRREKTAEYIGGSIASVTNWTKELYDNGMLEQYEVNYSKKGSQRIVRTRDFNKEKVVDHNEKE